MSVSPRRRLRGALAPIALLATVSPIGIAAQNTGSISGQILDALKREPIRDVIVSIVGSALSAGTDTDGYYTIDSVMPGLVKVKAQILGYVPITTDYYTIHPDSSTPVDFHLAPVLYELEGVEVTAQSPQRTWVQHQGSQVLTKEDIPQRGDILSALQGLVPSVRVRGRRDDTRLVVRNAAADVLYVVDGIVIRPPLTFYIDATQVDCVEVRRGFSAVAQFKPSIVGENYAGVVLIWTKGALGARPRSCVPDN